MTRERSLLVGWSSVSITPDLPVQLTGQHHVRISEYVRDPVTATALALASEGAEDCAREQAVIVSCDLAHIIRPIQDSVREALVGRVDGLDLSKLFLVGTHTHTGPTVREGNFPEPPPGVMRPAEYVEFLVARLANLVADAWQSRRPGGVSWALGHAAVGFNRRVAYDDGTSKMYGSTDTPRFVSSEGANDHGVEMLFCWDEDRELTGIVINLACPSQVVEMKHFISADFWGAARERIRARLSKDLYVVPLCSAAGDQSPRDSVRRGRGEADFRDESGLEEMGRRIAWAVDDVMEAARSDIRDSVCFRHKVETLHLPMRRVTQSDYEQAKVAYEELSADNPTPGSGEAGRAARFRRVMDKYEEQGESPTYTLEHHVIRLGDVALATNPFELFLDYGLRIKAQSRAVQTFVVQLACDRGVYLPTAKALQGGHYGASLTEAPVGPEGGEVLVRRTVELINGLWSA